MGDAPHPLEPTVDLGRAMAILLAVGCAWTRLLSGDHFLPDVTGAAMLAYAVTLPACRVLGLIPPKMPRFA